MSFSYCFSNLGVNLRLYSESTKFARVIHAKKLYARLNLIFFKEANAQFSVFYTNQSPKIWLL